MPDLNQASQAFRGSILHFLDDPGSSLQAEEMIWLEDGILRIEDGHIAELGDSEALLKRLPDHCQLHDLRGQLIMPGLIDAHIHYPQTDMIASYGEQLLGWLETYTFPTESQFANQAHAAEVAEVFLDELLRNGTTTACVFGTVHPESVTAFFIAAEQRNLRMIAGKVLMDRHCPDYLQDTSEQSYTDSKALIKQWHGRNRLSYAVTPRFAPTSSEAQLAAAAQLLSEHPDVYMHTHVAENRAEVEWIKELFPQSRSYLDVYRERGLLRKRSVMAHCIHFDAQDRQQMADCEAAAVFCASSNLFMGSGLF